MPDVTSRVSVIIPALNEEGSIRPALESVTWADEIVVVDSGSVDGTEEIALDRGARVVQFHYDGGSVKKKSWALHELKVIGDWTLILDADERITPALRDEILAEIQNSAHVGYCIDREFRFLGRRLRCFQPNWNLRLFRTGQATMEDLGGHQLPGTGDNEIHEQVIVAGSVGYLTNAMLHDDYRGIGPWIDKHNKYATWEAHTYKRFREEPLSFTLTAFADPLARKRMLRRAWVRLPARPLLRFLIWYLPRKGFTDGVPGLTYCLLMAWYELLIGVKLRELRSEAR